MEHPLGYFPQMIRKITILGFPLYDNGYVHTFSKRQLTVLTC